MRCLSTLGLILTFHILLSGCEKNDILDDLVLKGKVIRVTCASTVVQITNSQKYGENGWINVESSAGTQYDHVFVVENICKLNLENGKTFQFKIINIKENDCVQCLLYDAPPKISYAIELL